VVVVVIIVVAANVVVVVVILHFNSLTKISNATFCVSITLVVCSAHVLTIPCTHFRNNGLFYLVYVLIKIHPSVPNHPFSS